MIFDERLSKSTRLVADSGSCNNLRYVCIQVTCRVEHGQKARKKINRLSFIEVCGDFLFFNRFSRP